MNYVPPEATQPGGIDYDYIINDGHNIVVQMQRSKLMLITSLMDDQMVLTDVLHKLPAEHLINGVRHAVEQQLIFKPADGSHSDKSKPWSQRPKQIRISLLYDVVGNHEVDESDLLREKNMGPDIITQVTDHFSKLPEKEDALYLFLFVPQVDLTHDSIYTYEGSETYPPCLEEVTWLVSGRVRFIKKKAVDALLRGQAKVTPPPHGNARLVMPRSGRKIYKRTLIRPEKSQTFAGLSMREDNAEEDIIRIGYGSVIKSKSEEENSSFRGTLKDTIVGLSIILCALVMGLTFFVLIRSGTLPKTVIPSWMGGVHMPLREQWDASGITVFGSSAPQGDGEADLEDDDEEEEEEEEEAEDEEEEEHK